MKLLTVGLVLVTAAVAGCSSTTALPAGAIEDAVVGQVLIGISPLPPKDVSDEDWKQVTDGFFLAAKGLRDLTPEGLAEWCESAEEFPTGRPGTAGYTFLPLSAEESATTYGGTAEEWEDVYEAWVEHLFEEYCSMLK